MALLLCIWILNTYKVHTTVHVLIFYFESFINVSHCYIFRWAS